VLAVAIKVLSRYPEAVEQYYSTGLYPVLARLQRGLFGWIPFSVGDILYAAAFIWIGYGLVHAIRTMVRRQAGAAWWFALVRRGLFVFLWIYVLFNGLWGLNYDRPGIADELQLTVRRYSTAELAGLVDHIVNRLNDLDSLSRVNRPALDHPRNVFAGAVRAYDSLGRQDPRFTYSSASVKSSLFSYPGAWLGFGGYYNPFTGEAQVNTFLPVFTEPFTTCHEMGHQLGYARENEANIAGYLSARSSPDPAFRYSVYFDLYLYAARELAVRDSSLLKTFRARLRPEIRQDFQELKAFDRKYANPLEPLIWKAYGRFLRANRQPHGIVTYTEVTAWLIAYANKNGWDKI
jgi:hypothetical protein